MNRSEVKAVVTHAGRGATMEILWAGKPAVCLPCFGDQPMNARLLAQKGVGLTIPAQTATAARVKDAISEILSNASYRSSAQQLSSQLHLESGGAAAAAEFIEQCALGEIRVEEFPKSNSNWTAVYWCSTAAAMGAAVAAAWWMATRHGRQ
mmetsp:Transcript_31806/g.90345  ORF Transcript_31806/g.90345 Transcript_31806/m.90345 type:complete len:151 (-) Transcript_31806:159-611(-)